MNKMGESEIAIGLHDPSHRVMALEFQARDGSPLHYNHNGRYHVERTSEEKRFDVYDLRSAPPADAKMVCWLLTENSVIKMPLELTNISLPESRDSRPLPPPSAQENRK